MSPILSKEEADYFDILSTESLINRSKLEGMPHHLVADVDFVGPEASNLYIPNRYSLIVSSHVLEHQINVVKHLQDISNLLVPGGIYIALIPDLRYCFDRFQNPSTFVDVYCANLENPSKHSLKNYLEDRVLTTHNVASEHWRGISGAKKLEHLDENMISNYVTEYNNATENLDIHAWKFTPTTFHSVIVTLYKLKLINLELRQIAATFPGNNEFWAIFER